MTAHTSEIPADLVCHRCGYDLRAHAEDAKCPECGTPVAESRRLAPLRPVWRDSDPRWRRRMLAGAWLLVLLPLMDVLIATGWASYVPAPNIFGYGAIRTIDETFLQWPTVYPALFFCMGAALLFSPERGRRRNRLDWTRRWGVASCYIVLVLSAAGILFITSLVLAGIAALFQSMPPKYQPGLTEPFVNISTTWLRYGPHPGTGAAVVLVLGSSIAMLLAYIPLFNALRSSGSKRFALMLLAPLALFALLNLAELGIYGLGLPVPPLQALRDSVYFNPNILRQMANPAFYPPYIAPPLSPWTIFIEAAKWCSILGVAIWLTLAQLAAWSHRRELGKSPPAA